MMQEPRRVHTRRKFPLRVLYGSSCLLNVGDPSLVWNIVTRDTRKGGRAGHQRLKCWSHLDANWYFLRWISSWYRAIKLLAQHMLVSADFVSLRVGCSARYSKQVAPEGHHTDRRVAMRNRLGLVSNQAGRENSAPKPSEQSSCVEVSHIIPSQFPPEADRHSGPRDIGQHPPSSDSN